MNLVQFAPTSDNDTTITIVFIVAAAVVVVVIAICVILAARKGHEVNARIAEAKARKAEAEKPGAPITDEDG